MNMPRPEFIRGILPRELIDDPSIVLLSPKPCQLHRHTPIFETVSHGAGGAERFVILPSPGVLQDRTVLHYFTSPQIYRWWMKHCGRGLRGAIIYPTLYNVQGERVSGALLLVAYG